MDVNFANTHGSSSQTGEVYDWTEIAKHATKDDLWLVISGKVYDVTDFAEEHPGGIDWLLEYAGKDATAAWKKQGHSYLAKQLRDDLVIGSTKVE